MQQSVNGNEKEIDPGPMDRPAKEIRFFRLVRESRHRVHHLRQKKTFHCEEKLFQKRQLCLEFKLRIEKAMRSYCDYNRNCW